MECQVKCHRGMPGKISYRMPDKMPERISAKASENMRDEM
jgi:hypothetical protein